MSIKSFGTMGVDWEERVNFDRLRTGRLDRVKNLLKASDLGALLCFDMNNIRYLTATVIGTWSGTLNFLRMMIPSCGTSVQQLDTTRCTARG